MIGHAPHLDTKRGFDTCHAFQSRKQDLHSHEDHIQYEGVFNGHARSLPHVGCHRVAGVANQRDGVPAPLRNRRAVDDCMLPAAENKALVTLKILLLLFSRVRKRLAGSQSRYVAGQANAAVLQDGPQAHRAASECGTAAAKERNGSGHASPTLPECSVSSFLHVELIHQIESPMCTP